MKKIIKSSVLLSMYILIGWGASVYAQESEPEAFTLEEITVTSEKREVNVQAVPMSVTAISGSELTARAITSLDDALQGLAGVNVLAQPGGGNVFIRGVGSGLDANLADPSISIQIDNIYVGRHENMAASMFDIERVEVLRGPQGTIYGRNAAGGQINVISKKPTDEFEANVTLTSGNFNLENFTAAVNAPLTEKLALRVATYQEERDGYISDGSDSSDKFSARAKLLFSPSEDLSFLLTTEYTHDRSSPNTTLPAPGSAGNLPPFLPYAYPDVVETGWPVHYDYDAWTQDDYHPAPTSNNEFLYASVEVNWDMGWGQLYLLPALNDNDRSLWSELLMGTVLGGDNFNQAYTEKQYSMEARLQSPEDSTLDWLFGFYYLDSDNENANYVPPDPYGASQSAGGGWSTAMFRRPNAVTAYFGQATYNISDQFRITGGVRFTADTRKRGYQFANYDITDPTDTYYSDATVTADGRHEYDSGILEWEENFDNTSYRAGIEFDVAERSMLYAFVSTGYKAGGLNLQGQVPPLPYDPEEVVSYSIGSKNRFLNNRLELNVEAYYYDYKGFQIQDSGEYLNPFTGTISRAQIIKNATKGTNAGLEMEMDFLVTTNDRLTASLAYMATEFGALELAPNSLGGTTEPFQLEGMDMTQAPELSGSLGYEHTWILDAGGQITSSLQTKISDGYWTTEKRFYPNAWQGSYTMSDFYLTYLTPGEKYSMRLWGKNLENEAVNTRAFPMYRQFLLPPRTFGVTFSARF